MRGMIRLHIVSFDVLRGFAKAVVGHQSNLQEASTAVVWALHFFSKRFFDLLGFHQASDLVDAHLGPDRAVLSKHLRTQAGCRLPRREVGTVHTRLVDDNIVI
jgi:hypothetical protein